VALVRLGGASWYPEDPARQVRIEVSGGNNRYPGTLSLQARPVDDSGRFQYVWTSSLHPNLAQTGTRSSVSLSTPRNDSLETQPLALSVKVLFLSKDDNTWYEVGTAVHEALLVRNQPPRIEASWNGSPLKPGCDDQPLYAYPVYDAYDPDNGCLRVEVSSPDPFSSVGRFDTVLTCGLRAMLALNLYPHTAPPGIVLYKDNPITFRVVDDNLETDTAMINIRTFNNLPPTIDVALKNPPDVYYYTREAVQCSLFASDPEVGKLKSVRLYWGEGDTAKYDMVLAPFGKTFSHKYDEPGTHTITAIVSDNCKGVTQATLNVQVVRNSPPVIEEFSANGRDQMGVKLRVEISDANFDDGRDALNLSINWGDTTEFIPGPPLGEAKTYYHQYKSHWPDSTVFRIHLRAWDSQEGNTEDSLFIRKSDGLRVSGPASPGTL